MADCKYNLDGKRCIITGASRGLGADIARSFINAGAMVALTDVDLAGALAIAAELDPKKERTRCLPLDVTNEEQVADTVKRVVADFGGLDILVNVAGILKMLPIDEMPLEVFQRIINVNLTGTFLMCRESVRYMKVQKRGKIVNIASLGGVTGRPGVAVNYAASKAGVIGLTRALAKEQGPNGIYVNALSPGPILTELTKQVGEQVFAGWNVGRPLPKDGMPEDVADAVLFLASDQSDWITGISLDINGGIYM